jgi:hypothetical protein
VSLTAHTPHDYAVPGCTADPLCDDPSRAIDALADGHVAAFLKEQRLMGPVSIVLRAPFVALGGGDQLAHYRAGTLACLLLVAAFAVWMAVLAVRSGRPLWIALLAAVAVIAMPASVRVIQWGHPEELLTVALVLAAAFAASRGKGVWAGIALGLAVACKLWALATVPAVLLLVPRAARVRAGLVALAAVVVLYLPYAAAEPAAFRSNLHALGKVGSAPGTVSVANAWFPFADTTSFAAPVGFGPNGQVVTQTANGYSLPRWVARVAHAAVLLVGLVLALLWVRRRPPDLDGALLVVALALLVRCILDPGTFSYYLTSFVIVLIARDALGRRAPWLSLLAVLSLEALVAWFPHASSVHAFNAVYLCWSIGLAALLFWLLMRRDRAQVELASLGHGSRAQGHPET